MENATLSCAVLGCGLMGSRHAQTLRHTPGCRCVCVHDSVIAKAQTLAAQIGVEAVSDYREILKRDDINAVVICLPSSFHGDYGIQAAEAGKHVITEKPIDISLEKANALTEAADKHGTLLTVISQNRFLEGSMALKKAIDEGLLGDLLLANVSIKWYRDDGYYTKSDWRGTFRGEGGGVLMNQGIHYMDLLLWYMGDVAEAGSCIMTSRAILETEDVAAVLLKMKSGAIATITASTSAYPGFPERMELHGRRGSAVLEQGKIVLWQQVDGRTPPTVVFDPPDPPDLDAKLVPFQRQYRDILAALRNGHPPLVTPQEATRVVDTVLEAYRGRL